MNQPLLTIGAFARAVGLTPSALRHYDECGLLRPAEVDDATGYRYYTPELVRRAGLIAKLRAAEVPIETMRTVLDGTAAEAGKVLREHVELQAAKTARTEAAVAEVLATVEEEASDAGSARVSVPGPELAAALRQVRPAADHDAGSPLGSIVVDLAGESVDVVATNRFWMTVRTLPLPAVAPAGRIVLGLGDAAELATALDASDQAPVEIADGRVTFVGQEVAGRDVAYPAHRVVLDGIEPARTTAVLSTQELVSAIESLGRSEVVMTLTEEVARVSAGAEPSRSVSGTARGDGVDVRLGSALLLRALATMLGDEVRLELAAPDRPLVIRSPYQRGFVALVMPMGPA